LSINVFGSANVFGPLVAPILDYEPSPMRPTARLPVVPTLRPRTAPLTEAPRTVGSGPHPLSDDTRAAGMFADAALRRVLEVIDRRRPLAQLRGLLAGPLVDSLLAAAAQRSAGAGAARLRRVVAQQVRHCPAAVEVAASFIRDDRVHAVACRVEQVPGPAGPRWLMVALHMG